MPGGWQPSLHDRVTTNQALFHSLHHIVAQASAYGVQNHWPTQLLNTRAVAPLISSAGCMA